MSVVVETTLGDITIDLFIKQRPRACINFLKLCKMKYYNFSLFHTINRGFIAQTGDPTGSRSGGESIWGVIQGSERRYFEAESIPRIKHTTTGLVSFVGVKDQMLGSQFFITLAPDLMYLDEHHCVFGEVVEGLDVLDILNEAICDTEHRPYKDIRITHTVVLDDPFPDPKDFEAPDASPKATADRLQGGRIAPDEEIDEAEGKTLEEISEIVADREAKARATILEMVGDIPDADIAPPENVLFVCKLNPVTNDDDLEIIFSRFGKIKTCEVIRDKKTGDSLQYAFVEFEEQKSCEDAYFKMDNVLIDDRRIHVDFSQSVAKVKWLGKGRGVRHYDDEGQTRKGDFKNDVGNGRYKTMKNKRNDGPPWNDQRKREDKFEGRGRGYRQHPRDNRNYNRDNEFQRKNKPGFDKSRDYYPEEQARDKRRRSRSDSGERIRARGRADDKNKSSRQRDSSDEGTRNDDRKSYRKKPREDYNEEKREVQRQNLLKTDKYKIVTEERNYPSKSWGQSSADRSRSDQSRKRYEERTEDRYSSRSKADDAKSKYSVQATRKQYPEKTERLEPKSSRNQRDDDSSEDDESSRREKHKKKSSKKVKKKKKKSKKETSSSESSSSSSSESDEKHKKRNKKSRR